MSPVTGPLHDVAQCTFGPRSEFWTSHRTPYAQASHSSHEVGRQEYLKVVSAAQAIVDISDNKLGLLTTDQIRNDFSESRRRLTVTADQSRSPTVYGGQVTSRGRPFPYFEFRILNQRSPSEQPSFTATLKEV
jgi:hypothetical protein